MPCFWYFALQQAGAGCEDLYVTSGHQINASGFGAVMKQIGFVLTGLVLLGLGSKMLVDGAVQMFGPCDEVIGQLSAKRVAKEA